MGVELGNLTLEKLTHIAVRERARIVRHAAPGLAGDLSQVLGRASVEVELRGICSGPSAADELEGIRQAYREGKPLDFLADATGSGYFTQVLISQLDVRQRAGALDEFEFACEVVEFIEPPAPAAAGLMGELDAGILSEASAFMDDVQDSLAGVASLAALASQPGFADPTVKLRDLPKEYEASTSGLASLLAGIGDLVRLESGTAPT